MKELAPLLLSLAVAAGASCLVLLLALPLAALFRKRRGLLWRLAEGLFMIPLVLPPTVTGYLLLALLGNHGPLGSLLLRLGIPVVFTRAAAVIASATVAFPLMYQSCRSALDSVDGRFARAAGSLGASPLRCFLLIELPLAATGILGGLVLAFARAFGEFGATLMLAGNIPGLTETLPLAVYSAVEAGEGGRARLLLGATVLVALALVALLSLAGAWPGLGRSRGRREV